MLIKLFLIFSVFFNLSFVFFSDVAFAQGNSTPIKECKVSSAKNVKYKLISIGKAIRKPYITGLRIVVKDKFFTKDSMVQLAKIIKGRYCNEETIAVTIFDDAKVAKQARAVIDQLTANRKVPEIRGFYSLDRKTGEESISYSAKRGNSPSEISIQLSNNLSMTSENH